MKEVHHRATEQLCIDLGLEGFTGTVVLKPGEFTFSAVLGRYTFPQTVVDRERQRLAELRATIIDDAAAAVLDVDTESLSEREEATTVYDPEDYYGC